MTELFKISPYFKDVTREVIEEAVKRSKLPEGISIVSKKEFRKAKKPFLVIAHAGYTNEASEVIKAGGDYVEFVNDIDLLTTRLND